MDRPIRYGLSIAAFADRTETVMLELPSLLDAEVGHVLREAVVENRSLGAFKVNRRVFTDEAVLAAERRIIFDHCCLYLGHASEVPDPSSFVTRSVGGRPLIFNRGRDGTIQAFFNTCSHRGALVCR